MGVPASTVPALPDDGPPREQRAGRAPAHRRPQNLAAVAVCLGLVVAVWVVYLQTRSFEFVNYDDPVYVTANPHVTAGLTSDGAIWALTRSHAANWHPLTWLSHMADWHAYGDWAGGHHLTSVALHSATAVVLFVALRRLTGETWPSAAVVALWAVHPLRVESVAWVSERKDVLSGLFFALTLLAYERYARSPSTSRYLLVAAALAAGLMSKAMLVTVPCVLLLLDYWPLNRLGTRSEVRRAVREKLPLFALVVAASAATYAAQEQGGAVNDLSATPLAHRLGNATVSYATYIVQTAWPTGLVPFYPHPGSSLPGWQVLASLVLLVGVSGLLIRFRQRLPAVAVGWLWYLGTLVPVIGIVQVGLQAHADRYTYLPQIGLLIALVWGARHWVTRGTVLVVGVVPALLAFGVASALQASLWHDSGRLFSHALSHNSDNYIAHQALGAWLERRGQADEALEHFLVAARLAPFVPKVRSEGAKAQMRRGMRLLDEGQLPAATADFAEAIRLDPRLAAAHDWYGVALGRAGRTEEALESFKQANQLDPELVTAKSNLTNAYLALGQKHFEQRRVGGAVQAFARAVELDPNSIAARNNLGVALHTAGRSQEAAAQFRKVLELDPADADARNNLNAILRK